MNLCAHPRLLIERVRYYFKNLCCCQDWRLNTMKSWRMKMRRQQWTGLTSIATSTGTITYLNRSYSSDLFSTYTSHGPGQAKPQTTALAWPDISESQSHGFQAKPGQKNTSSGLSHLLCAQRGSERHQHFPIASQHAIQSPHSCSGPSHPRRTQ
jgi:hypothetical protein